MEAKEKKNKVPSYKVKEFGQIFHIGYNHMEEMNELLNAHKKTEYENKMNIENISSNRLITQAWWKD